MNEQIIKPAAQSFGGGPPSTQHLATTLCGNGDRATIIHRGNHYLLRITRNGKLILTK